MWHAPVGLDTIDKRATRILHGQRLQADLRYDSDIERKMHTVTVIMIHLREHVHRVRVKR